MPGTIHSPLRCFLNPRETVLNPAQKPIPLPLRTTPDNLITYVEQLAHGESPPDFRRRYALSDGKPRYEGTCDLTYALGLVDQRTDELTPTGYGVGDGSDGDMR